MDTEHLPPVASFTLSQPATFPEGTSVGAYPATNWPNRIVNQAAAPIGSATNSQTVTNGSLTFTGLTNGVRYYAYSLVGSAHRYVTFTPGADTEPGEGSSLPAGGTAGQVLAKASSDEGDADWVTPEEVDAGDIPFTPAGGIAATDVQAAIVEAKSDNDVASEIAFTPVGTVAATDVQAAIAEVAAESPVRRAKNGIFPVALGNAFGTLGLTAVANRIYLVGINAERAASLDGIRVPISSTGGNLQGAVYDCGAATPDVLTKLSTVASAAVGASSEWQTLTLPAPISLVADQQVFLAVQFSATPATVRAPAPMIALPDDVGSVGGITGRMVASCFADPGSYTLPSTIAEGSLTASGSIPTFIGHVA